MHNGKIKADDLHEILIDEGSIHEQDAIKIKHYFVNQGKIDF